MMKQALRSYLASLHSGNLEKLRGEIGYMWMYIVLFMSWGLTSLISDQTYADTMWAWFLRMIPLGLMLWSDLVSKFLMPKAMFLCPMKEEERKKYINCVLIVKISVVVLASIVVELVWSVFYGFQFVRLCVVIFAFFSLAIANYFGVEFKNIESKKTPFVVRQKDGTFLIDGNNTISLVLMMVMMYGITAADVDNRIWSAETSILYNAFMIFCASALLFFDVMIIKDQYKYVVEQSSDYELHFKVKGKVESPKKYDLFAK